MEALSMPVQEAVASSSYVAEHAPAMLSTLRAVLDRRRGSDAAASRPYELGFVGSAFELHAFTSDGIQKRTQVRLALMSSWILGCNLCS
jgi:hypothetical protein